MLVDLHNGSQSLEEAFVEFNRTFPPDSFIVLGSNYTEQKFAVMKIRTYARLELSVIDINFNRKHKQPEQLCIYYTVIANLEAFWLDGGYKHYPNYRIHTMMDPHKARPLVTEEDRAMLALTGPIETHYDFMERVKL